MQSILFLQSCSLPALSFFKCLLMAYSPACVLPLPFPHHSTATEASMCTFGKQGDNLKQDIKKKRV